MEKLAQSGAPEEIRLHKQHRRLPFGLRTIKTFIAVTIAVWLTGYFSSVSRIYAAMGAVVAMDRTLSDSMKDCLTQMIGVTCGALFGYVIVMVFGSPPEPLVLGLGVMAIILVCILAKVPFAISLSCVVMFSVCLSPGENILWCAIFRLRDTSFGLVTALVVNATIRPYNNTWHVLAMFQEQIDMVPEMVRTCLIEQKIPDVRPMVRLLLDLEKEIDVLRSQRFFRKKRSEYDAVYLEGCLQLGIRIRQELDAICCMDSPGNVGVENGKRLTELGLELPEEGLPRHKCTKHDTIVLNYHLEKLLDARKYLCQMLPEEPPRRWWQRGK